MLTTTTTIALLGALAAPALAADGDWSFLVMGKIHRLVCHCFGNTVTAVGSRGTEYTICSGVFSACVLQGSGVFSACVLQGRVGSA